MSSAQRVALAAVLTAAVVGVGVGVVTSDPPKKVQECVIPKCDATQKPVDCLRLTPAFLDKPAEYRWFGCNVFPKAESKGEECMPADCVKITAETQRKPRVLK